MSSRDRLKVILLYKLIRNVLAKSVASTARADAPPSTVVGVRPKQVTHGPLVGNLDHAIDTLDLVECVQAWRQTSMQAEDLVLDHSSQRQVIKQVSQELPHVCIAVLAHTLVVKAIDLGDLAAFVITSQNGETVTISNLEAH